MNILHTLCNLYMNASSHQALPVSLGTGSSSFWDIPPILYTINLVQINNLNYSLLCEERFMLIQYLPLLVSMYDVPTSSTQWFPFSWTGHKMTS